MSTKPLLFASVLAACTANAASPASSPAAHACAPALPDDAVPHDVLRIASPDGSTDLVLHAWTDRDGTIIDVHTVWQASMYAEEAMPPFAVRPDVLVDAESWRVSIIDGAARHEIEVHLDDDGDVLAFASVVTGDDEPTWCRLRSARFLAQRRDRSGAGRIETRCEDASGSEVEGMVARATD